MKKLLGVIAALVLVASFWACREQAPEAPGAGSSSADQAILAAVEKNVAAMNDEDLEAYMATIHEDSPLYQPTRENLARVFAGQDLRIQLKDAQVVERGKDMAGVRYVQTVRETDPKRPGKTVKQIGYNVMKKSGGTWKIFDSKVIEEIPLDH